MKLSELRSKIESRDAVLGVVGLGYVGLPVSCAFAEAGFRVVGIDINTSRVDSIRSGRSPIDGQEPGLPELLTKVVREGRLTAADDYAKLSDADVVLIAVETPVASDHKPRYEALASASRAVGGVLKQGALVIVESTVAPGTMEQLVRPLLETATGGKANQDFFLGHCPERVMPGRMLANLRHVGRVCGGMSQETAEVMVTLYRSIVDAELDPSDCLTAELVKTVENAYRDVNIAFANEVALVCEELGADVWTVRDLVNKSPGRDMLLPGAGVGGHCIPKDSWLLIANANGLDAKLVTAARAVNDAMPLHVAHLVEDALMRADRRVADGKVALLGYSYLGNTGDTRNSPSIPLVEQLRSQGADVRIHDPHVPEYSSSSLAEAIRGADCIVLMVAHDEYRDLDWPMLRQLVRTPLVVDGRNIAGDCSPSSAGFTYVGLGRSAPR
ncbi:MAG: nucleotide sugar dehydrogenase [Chloroflexota bacterium]|nr:nucleotide sugar dehydrogenase [Chloroflexota bacterium]